MFYTFSFNYVINHLMLNSQKKKLKFEILYSKRNLRLIIFFKKIGLIRNFYCFLNKNYFKIKITVGYHKFIPIFKKIKLLSTPSRFFFISNKALKLMHCRTLSSLCVLSTSCGIMTHAEALKLGIGGKLLMLTYL